MKTIYILNHTRHNSVNSYTDTKGIGAFFKIEDCEKARAKVISQPGFSDHPQGFWIQIFPVEESSEYFAVEYIDPFEDSDFERIWIYSVKGSLGDAQLEKSTLIQLGRKEEEVFITPLSFDTISWSEGFISWAEASEGFEAEQKLTS